MRQFGVIKFQAGDFCEYLRSMKVNDDSLVSAAKLKQLLMRQAVSSGTLAGKGE